MSVYVDAVTEYDPACIQPQARKHGQRWSHMWCDEGDDEGLHRIAQSIGLKREWYQAHGSLWHYDCTPSKRALAIRAGAKEMNVREWMRNQTPEQRERRRNRKALP
jgi:hypothetical protein